RLTGSSRLGSAAAAIGQDSGWASRLRERLSRRTAAISTSATYPAQAASLRSKFPWGKRWVGSRRFCETQLLIMPAFLNTSAHVCQAAARAHRCRQRWGEATAIFLDDSPTVRLSEICEITTSLSRRAT